MRKLLKWIAIVLGGLVGLLLLAVIAVYALSSTRINRTHEIEVETVALSNDAESVAWGEHIVLTRGCTGCHGQNLAGITFVDDPAFGTVYSSNLTPGAGGIGGIYGDADYVRAIRHGVNPEGEALLVMPSHEYYYLSDRDLGALIAYLKTVQPVDNQLPDDSVGPLARVLFLAGQLPLLPVEMIDHNARRPEAPEPGVTAEYGGYLAIVCQGCHGQDYAGGPIPGAAPDAPLARNLTPAGNLANWTGEDFVTTIRTGITPEGDELNPEYMPWPEFANFTDEELQAIWLFLQSLPPVSAEG